MRNRLCGLYSKGIYTVLPIDSRKEENVSPLGICACITSTPMSDAMDSSLALCIASKTVDESCDKLKPRGSGCGEACCKISRIIQLYKKPQTRYGFPDWIWANFSGTLVEVPSFTISSTVI